MSRPLTYRHSQGSRVLTAAHVRTSSYHSHHSHVLHLRTAVRTLMCFHHVHLAIVTHIQQVSPCVKHMCANWATPVSASTVPLASTLDTLDKSKKLGRKYLKSGALAGG